jgi:hypothetical protein
MDSNPYMAPAAAVEDPTRTHADTGEPAFFAVSPLKLVVMSLCTFGLYEFWWFYQNWRIIRMRTKEAIRPFWRTFFAVLFCYQLFLRVRGHGPGLPAAGLAAGPLAAAWIILTSLWKLPDPWWLVSFLAVFALLPVQSAITKVNDAVAPGHAPNSRFSAWNWGAVAIGGPLFLLGVIATLVPSVAGD